VKMITSLPAILGYALDNIRGRIADLHELGFADPVKMIAYFPSILGLGIDNIRGRIADLRELGVADPVKMITSSPTILGLAIDNIRGRVADLRQLGFNDPVKMVASRPAILGYARERVLLCGRIVMRLEERTDNMLGRLIKESRAVIDAVAVAQPRTWSDVHAIIVMAKRGAAKTAKG
jgi:mTERF